MSTESAPQKRPRVIQKMIWLRRAVQALFLLAFLYLLAATMQGAASRMPYDVFFHLDPLTAVTSLLAGRVWIVPMTLGLITLVLAVALGRAWCGWVCPLGTILDCTPSRRRPPDQGLSPRWSQVKYFLFLTVILGAALGSLTLVILDPLTLLFRAFAAAILPSLNLLIGGAESWLYGFSALQPALVWIDGALRGWLLNNQPFYLPNLLFLAVLAAVLALNAVRSRFWCRCLCPLGGMLGLISKVAVIRHHVDPDQCISCGQCSALCPTGAIDPDKQYAADAAECTVCLKCRAGCPVRAISFGPGKTAVYEHSPERRRFLYSLGAAAVAALFLRFVPSLAGDKAKVIRPPGSSEKSLASQCIRCGECIRICPTGVIQPGPAGAQSGLWTPELKTRLGYCDYSCNACGIACPTGAISNLPLAVKQKTVVGVAKIDQTRCIPWAEDRDCIVCEEMCPIPEKAIRLGGGGGGQGTGRGRHPRVIAELCTGCGICEHQCPVAGESAIRVFPPETST
jgi:MauM/NapG family ferredoxin protein